MSTTLEKLLTPIGPPSDPLPVGAPAGPITVLEVRDANALRAHIGALEELAAAALEPNVFYEPWMLFPALEFLQRDEDVHFLLVYKQPASNQRCAPRLCGFFPLVTKRHHRGLPIKTISLWQHKYCFLCLPLLHRQHASAALDAYLGWFESSTPGPVLVELNQIPGEGRFHQLIVEDLDRRGKPWLVSNCFTRALLLPETGAADYLEQAISSSRRKELRRLKKRLSELGDLSVREAEPGCDISAWIDNFLRLEASGWKATRGTAMSQDAASMAFFAGIAHEAFRRGRLMMLGIFINDRPIAMKCNLLACPGSFAFKIAFDEEFANFSPGVQLEIENILRLQNQPSVAWMDSCALPHHPMINTLWMERRVIQTILFAKGAAGSAAVVMEPLRAETERKLMPAYKKVKRMVKRHNAVITLQQVSKPERILDVTSDVIKRELNEHPFSVHHSLVGHVLFELPRLVELARALPADHVEYNAGDLPVNMDPKLTPSNGLSIDETIRRIQDCKSWMVLKWVEDVPEYKKLLDACLDQVATQLGVNPSAMMDREGFIFVSSPGSVTPFHMDPELNFLLQLRGTKQIHVFPKQLVTPQEIEQRFAGSHRNLIYRDEYAALANTFELRPGDGVHVPIAAPHWVKVGDDFSISFSITFHTAATQRDRIIHAVNGKLRKIGLQPSPVGRSTRRDAMKFHAYSCLRTLKQFRR